MGTKNKQGGEDSRVQMKMEGEGIWQEDLQGVIKGKHFKNRTLESRGEKCTLNSCQN